MSTEISLHELLDLSIGTPDAGSVNFGALHALLRAILGHLKIERLTTSFKELSMDHDGSTQTKALMLEPSSSQRLPEERLRRLEEQMCALEDLPSAAELMGSDKALSDLWSIMQIRRKAQGNEDGVSKCMALIQDLLKEIQALKESRDDLRQEVTALNGQLSQLNVNELAERIVAMEQFCQQVENLENSAKELKDKMAQYPSPEELTQCVTWEVMQAALISENPKTQEGLHAAKHTEPVHPSSLGSQGNMHSPSNASDGALCAGMGRQMSRISIGAERYPETVGALMDLARLKDRQESVEARVAQLQANKADLSQLQHLHDLLTAIEQKQIPDHVPEQLNHLRTLVDSLLADKEKSTGLLRDVQESMLQLQAEFEKLHSTSNHLMEEHHNKQTHIDHLYKIVEELGVKKADKELVEMEIEIKADKQALDNKVSSMQFDSMTEQLNNMLQELLSKITGQEQDWNKVIEKISTEMDSKLNRIELDPLKKQLDDRWRTIHKQLQTPQMPEQEDAAGIRKQLVARFHCISCDRPVEMMTPGQHLMSLPSAPGLPSHKSSRPYTVYELEQVRQHCRSERIPEMADYSYLSRSCGGSHTLTYPSRRYTRLQHITHLIQSQEESRPVSTGPPAQAAEVNILGLNGQVYKGRMNSRAVRLPESRLPNISPREGQWRSREKTSSRGPSQRSSAASPARPHSAMTKASRSASSSLVRDRPTSSMGCLSQDVPLQSPVQREALELHKDLGQSEDEPVTSL
ncbi:uncharacterized protein isoform X8 [Danio rerio]|uniref:Uncharacterized protein isoform X8 n=3 Tax=Danio rerio TaxID=7955 RepID=A0AC58J4D5_DANRE|nr:uncharacterized protein C16orf96 homolog [Danio rerio]|eukprot:XP_009298152.2 uncharacterized protein C16orf96 homolog [Danio rerio]